MAVCRSKNSREMTKSSRVSSVVTRIVFVDKQECCDCTRRAIDESWAALQAALGPDHGLALERVFSDTETARADELRALRPLVTVPGIYFLDAAGRVVELLQGTVTADEIRAALPAKQAPPKPAPPEESAR